MLLIHSMEMKQKAYSASLTDTSIRTVPRDWSRCSLQYVYQQQLLCIRTTSELLSLSLALASV